LHKLQNRRLLLALASKERQGASATSLPKRRPAKRYDGRRADQLKNIERNTNRLDLLDGLRADLFVQMNHLSFLGLCRLCLKLYLNAFSQLVGWVRYECFARTEPRENFDFVPKIAAQFHRTRANDLL
jgi:hypothetical protein